MLPTHSPYYQKAFEQYLRLGVPIEISLKALESAAHHLTPRYVWMTAGDEKVRPSHAANDGKIFRWSDPPATGHPGEDIHCRCIAVPYADMEEAIGLAVVITPLTRARIIASHLLRAAIRRAMRKEEAEIERARLTSEQQKNLARFEDKLPKDAGKTSIIKGPKDTIVFRSDVPARNIPKSFARYEKVVDRAGNTVSYRKITYGSQGELINIKVKYGE